MISMLNFGESPFRFLFILVAGIFVAVLIANVVAASMTVAINWRKARILKRYEASK